MSNRVEPEWVEVDLKRIAVERCREFGGPWLGRVESLQRAMASGREVIPWPVMVLRAVIFCAAT